MVAAAAAASQVVGAAAVVVESPPDVACPGFPDLPEHPVSTPLLPGSP